MYFLWIVLSLFKEKVIGFDYYLDNPYGIIFKVLDVESSSITENLDFLLVLSGMLFFIIRHSHFMLNLWRSTSFIIIYIAYNTQLNLWYKSHCSEQRPHNQFISIYAILQKRTQGHQELHESAFQREPVAQILRIHRKQNREELQPTWTETCRALPQLLKDHLCPSLLWQPSQQPQQPRSILLERKYGLLQLQSDRRSTSTFPLSFKH